MSKAKWLEAVRRAAGSSGQVPESVVGYRWKWAGSEPPLLARRPVSSGVEGKPSPNELTSGAEEVDFTRHELWPRALVELDAKVYSVGWSDELVLAAVWEGKWL
ncbi:MAG: hypothetical protein ACREKN_09475 [Longimicrobiaceae bacterium]